MQRLIKSTATCSAPPPSSLLREQLQYDNAEVQWHLTFFRHNEVPHAEHSD
eukprot:CAMPEP_0171643722 /NCGR_PEP_ID=MMETSP0990-20121206/32897_1 /TAXON_ID=483369 /ORGANISM="non described non described, Strain CCMP2098" /LENGTH=50 /DNA_ID=CAMNT_0012219543 /DNA_START=69 /DNA_END=219 /DNA_ORIENTATION=-